MSTAAVLADGGIVDPPTVIAAAEAVGLPLALACALLQQESGGGANVWGSDPVQTGGVYLKGGPVTEANYRAYRRLADRGEIGRQGCGPCQLTARGFQDAADARGGCWDPRANMLAGFSGLVTLTNTYGLPDGVRRYNGSGPAAERYRDQVLERYRVWTTRLRSSMGEDDVSWTHAEGAPPVPDLYPGRPQGATLPDPLVGLSWAIAHAAVARDMATQALQQIQALHADLTAGKLTAAITVDHALLARELLVQLARPGDIGKGSTS